MILKNISGETIPFLGGSLQPDEERDVSDYLLNTPPVRRALKDGTVVEVKPE